MTHCEKHGHDFTTAEEDAITGELVSVCQICGATMDSDGGIIN